MCPASVHSCSANSGTEQRLTSLFLGVSKHTKCYEQLKRILSALAMRNMMGNIKHGKQRKAEISSISAKLD